MTLQEILADIHALEEDLLAFERKYGIRSEFFYAAYVSIYKNQRYVSSFEKTF